MEPTLQDGQLVLARPARRSDLVEGDLVWLRHPFKRTVRMIKRLLARDAEGRLLLAGDNPSESTDSRQFGAVDPARCLGTVTSRW